MESTTRADTRKLRNDRCLKNLNRSPSDILNYDFCDDPYPDYDYLLLQKQESLPFSMVKYTGEDGAEEEKEQSDGTSGSGSTKGFWGSEGATFHENMKHKQLIVGPVGKSTKAKTFTEKVNKSGLGLLFCSLFGKNEEDIAIEII